MLQLYCRKEEHLMNDRKRWPNKEAAKQYMAAYRARVDSRDSKGNIIPGPKGLGYWAAHDYVFNKKAA